MFEEKSKNFDFDRLLINRGRSHQGVFARISEKLAGVLDEEIIFSREAQQEIDAFCAEKAAYLPKMFSAFYQAYLESGASRPTAHEVSHILDNLNSALRISLEYEQAGRPSLTEGERFEVFLSCIGHDVGRYAEPLLPDMSERDVAHLIPAILGRHLMKKFRIPLSFGNRILYNIGSNFSPETGHRTADIVHQCDREQLLGATMLPRTFIFGIDHGSYDFAWPSAEEMNRFKTELANPYSSDVFSIPLRIEFWLRNVYDPISPDGCSEINKGKVESIVILMLSLKDFPESYRDIVFGPEEHRIPRNLLGKFKKALPEELYQSAKYEFDRFLKTGVDREYDGHIATLIHRIIGIEKLVTGPNFEANLVKKLDDYNPLQKRNLWLIFMYVLNTRHERRLRDLKKLSVSMSGLCDEVRVLVSKELNDRENVFTSYA